MIRNSSFFLLLLIGSFSFASISRTVDKVVVVRILAKSSSTKFSELKKMGPDVYGVLKALAFDENRPLSTRWQAFMAMVRLGERESIPEINRALDSSDWFLRDAALRVLPALDENRAYLAALNRLEDSALVVRTSAVDALAQIKKSECSDKLWNQLYSKDNYIRHQSLWIRRHIVEALAEVAPAGSEEKFVKVLSDSDSTLFGPAIKGLERLTGKKFGEAHETAVFKRYYWEKWYKDLKLKTKES